MIGWQFTATKQFGDFPSMPRTPRSWVSPGEVMIRHRQSFPGIDQLLATVSPFFPAVGFTLGHSRNADKSDHNTGSD